MPGTQYAALASFATDAAARGRLNDALSDAAGDVQDLSEADRAAVQRVDRASAGDATRHSRGHVVDANLQVPAAGRGSTLGVLRQAFPPGTEVSFDRFTGTAHTMHETDPDSGAGTMPVLEMQTRRGIYLGRSDSVDDTTHLLPRGMRFRVVSSPHQAAYRKADGTIGRRPVIQLQDIDSGPASQE